MKHLWITALIALVGCASDPMLYPMARGDAVDRIVAAVGVDSMHTEQEAASARASVHQIVDDGDSAAIIAMREPAEFEKMVRQIILDNQRMRRDPSVFQAYRTTLERMLTPAERRSAADFYASPEGRRAHIAVIEAERAAGAAMDEVTARLNKGPGPTFTHYFLYDLDVYFSRRSSEIDSTQTERIAKILKTPREDKPDTDWCVMLHGYGDTNEEASKANARLVERRNEAVKASLINFGINEVKIHTLAGGTKYAIYPPADPRNSRVEIEQFPCNNQ